MSHGVHIQGGWDICVGLLVKTLCFASVAGVVVLAVAGCASTASQLAVPYSIEFETAADVNPDARGRASPIRVQLFELKSDTAFQASDFFALQRDATKALGAELIKNEQLMLKPGERGQLSGGSLQARVVGVVAEYRSLESNQWRIVVPLPEPKNTNIYKFWQFSPSKNRLRIAVKNGGLEVLPAGK